VGIGEQTLRFLDVFLLHCLMSDSAPDTPHEIAAIGRNQLRTAARGREPGLRLERGAGEIELVEWGAQLLAECAPAAAALDATHGTSRYGEALADAQRVLTDLDSAPSARVLATTTRDFDASYVGFIRAQSAQTRAALLALPYPAALAQRFAAMAKESVEARRRIEAADTLPFEEYRRAYLSVERLGA
jgi:glutamate--cysteine ligase